MVKIIETESRVVAARGWVEGEIEWLHGDRVSVLQDRGVL